MDKMVYLNIMQKKSKKKRVCFASIFFDWQTTHRIKLNDAIPIESRRSGYLLLYC